MRRVLMGVLLVGVAVSARAQEPLPATDITAAQMQAFLAALPRNAISDLPVRVADVGGYRVGVFGVFRPKTEPGDAIAHETRTSEVYYILEGGGTLVTGGKIVNPKLLMEVFTLLNLRLVNLRLVTPWARRTGRLRRNALSCKG